MLVSTTSSPNNDSYQISADSRLLSRYCKVHVNHCQRFAILTLIHPSFENSCLGILSSRQGIIVYWVKSICKRAPVGDLHGYPSQRENESFEPDRDFVPVKGMGPCSVNYVDLRTLLFEQCTETPTFLHENDFKHFSLNTFAEPPLWTQTPLALTDYGAYGGIPLALRRRQGDDMTLLLPFEEQVGTSIWVWQRTWDVNQQFAVRIAKPLCQGDCLLYPASETAYFAVLSKNDVCLDKALLAIKSPNFSTSQFESAADVFLHLLEQCVIC